MEPTAVSRIYTIVALIPPGSVATYGQVAALAGQPCRARLVGRLLAALPHDRDVPWHRVINARGRISLPAGSPAALRQRARLEREGIEFRPDGRVDLSRFRWRPGAR